jgi:hypothetical protein
MQRALTRATTPVGRKPGVVADAPATSDVRLRVKADHQRIRNRVRGIGRRCHCCVLISQDVPVPAKSIIERRRFRTHELRMNQGRLVYPLSHAYQRDP